MRVKLGGHRPTLALCGQSWSICFHSQARHSLKMRLVPRDQKFVMLQRHTGDEGIHIRDRLSPFLQFAHNAAEDASGVSVERSIRKVVSRIAIDYAFPQ